MKKTLKKDITRYDKKMQLQFNKATIKAVGISLTVAIPLFLLFNFIAGIVPGIFIAFTVGCLLTTLQVGKIDGIPLIQYALKALKFAFSPKGRKKHYSHDSGEYRLLVLTERELKQNERKNINGKKKGS